MWALMWMAFRNKRGFESKRAHAYRGIARVFGYVLLITIGFGAFSVHSARAEMEKKSLELGRNLAPLAHLLEQQSTIDIDGESISMGMGASNEGLGAVLDQFENHCRENGVAGSWDNGAMAKAKILPRSIADMGVIRSSTKVEGVVLCFIKADDTPDTLVGKLEQFKRTHDLSALGKVRYAYANVEKNGKTSIMTLWTEGHLRLDRLMPTETFEPGSDNPRLPRPFQSRRVLSGALEGTPYGVRGYISKAKPREVLDHMDTDMTGTGWTNMEHPTEASARAYVKDGVVVFMTAIENDGKTVVSLSEMGGQQPVRVGVEAAKPVSIVEK